MLRCFARTAALAAALGTLAGCPVSREGTFDSGLPEDRTIGSLSDAEIMQLCVATIDAQVETFDGSRRGFCTYQILAGGGASSSETCRAAVDACAAGPPAMPPADCGTARPMPACPVTVGEFEVCVGDMLDGFRTAGDGLDCSLVGSPMLSELLAANDPTQVPPSCVPIMSDTRCRGGAMP
jgi:hypothetical protein